MDHIVEILGNVLRWLTRRPRLAVRIIEDNIGEGKGDLRFEIENRSGIVTSLLPKIKCKYYYVSKMKIRKGHNRYFVREAERRLDPFSPIVLHATVEHRPAFYNFSWFRTYVFSPARGLKTKVRIRNALLEPVRFPRFMVELARFRFMGNVPADPHSSIDDLERLQRSQGPH